MDVSLHNSNSYAPTLDRAVEIERLAALDTVDYEIARKDAADQLGKAALNDKLA